MTVPHSAVPPPHLQGRVMLCPQDLRAPVRGMAGNSRCPSIRSSANMAKEVWADEPFPDRMHSRGIFDGSALGSPAENGQFAQHLYKPFATDQDNLTSTP